MNSSIASKEDRKSRDINESVGTMLRREKDEAKQKKDLEKKSRNLVETIRKSTGVGE